MKDRDAFPVLGASGDSSDTGAGVRATEDWVYDTDGSDADDNTLFGDVDGRATSLGGLKNFITEDVYTKEETDQAIDRLAAYYITSNAEGDAFATYAALASATTYYSGGVERTPTRNDYAVVLADETHGGSEWRYIFAVPDGQTDGQWEPQYPIETNDYEALSNKPQINGNELSGNKTGAQLGLQDTLTFDTTPTAGSSNPVTSGGIQAAYADTVQQVDNVSPYVSKLAGTALGGASTSTPVVFTAAGLGVDMGATISALSIRTRPYTAYVALPGNCVVKIIDTSTDSVIATSSVVNVTQWEHDYTFPFATPFSLDASKTYNLLFYQSAAATSSLTFGYYLDDSVTPSPNLYLTNATQPASRTWRPIMTVTVATGSLAESLSYIQSDSIHGIKFNGTSLTRDYDRDIDLADALTSSDLPQMDGTSSAGTAVTLAKSDHIHPSDVKRADNHDMARYFLQWNESTAPDERAGTRPLEIYFTPSAFGATADCVIRVFSVQYTDSENDLPRLSDATRVPAMAQLMDPSNGNVLARSQSVNVPTGGENKFYDFVFSEDVTLTYTKQYKIRFVSAIDESTDMRFAVRLNIHTGTHAIYIGNDTNYLPITKFLFSQESLGDAFAEKSDKSDIAPDFSSSATYAEGQLVNYNGTIYICTTAVTTPGPWTGSTNWSASNATVQDAINAIDVSSQITGKIDSTSIAQDFDAGQAYAAGTYVTHEGVLYQFTADHAAGVSWEASASLVETAVVMEDVITDISGKADSVAIDAEYDESDTYDEGDTCMYEGKWYTCNTAISTAEAWDPSHWTAQTVKEVMTEIDASKLDSTSAAPAFDPTQSYSVNEYVTYNGALYVCTTAHAAAAWNPAHFTLTNMVTPDATLDVTSAGALRVVAADGEILWQQGYKLDSTSATTPAVTLSNESVNYYASPANSPDDVVLTLPAITTNPPKVSDFILEVSNPALTKVYGDGTTTVAAYDSASTYAVDDTVSYNGSVWKCNTASTTGTWDPTHWDYVAEYILQYSTSTTYAVGARVLHTDSSVVKIYSCNTANTTGTWADAKWNLVGYYIPTYNSASTYAQGAKVIYGDGLYSCNTAGTTGTWDSSKWDEAVLALSLGTALDNTISVVIPDGDDLSEMFLIGWGEMSEFYFTLTAFKVNGKPTYKIVKQVVVNGGAA